MKKGLFLIGTNRNEKRYPLVFIIAIRARLRKQSILPVVLCSFILTGLASNSLTAQTTDVTIFPLNEYLFVKPGIPYPSVNKDKIRAIDTSQFISVMQFGAKGDGKTLDDVAIANAFKSAEYGVIFPAGKIFLVSKLSKVVLTHNLTVYAYGATIKMADFSRYSFLNLEFQEGSYHNTVIWLGGTLDGNKSKQSWMGSPTGNDTWAEDHGRFVGVNYAQFALFKDVSIKNTVMDGISLESNRIAVISDCIAKGGASLKYSEVQEQGTYFKCTRSGSQAFYCSNLLSQGGSIGIQYSTSNGTASDSSLSVITNCTFHNQAQDALHFEDCKKIFLYMDSIDRDSDANCNADVHISNATVVASLKNCYFKNARVDFNNSTSLKLGMIDSCQFMSTCKASSFGVATFVVGRPTICTNSSFSGKTILKYHGALKNVRNCSFSNFDSLAVAGGYAVDSSVFTNGMQPASLSKGGFIINNTYVNVQNSASKAKPVDDQWQTIYLSFIDILSDTKTYLGRIGYTGTIADSINKYARSSQINLKTVNFEKSKQDNAQTILLYPNPAVSEAHLKLGEELSGKITIQITDINGRIVKSYLIDKKTAVASQTIDVSYLKTGSYILQAAGINLAKSFTFMVMK